jgi:hypothetical protein
MRRVISWSGANCRFYEVSGRTGSSSARAIYPRPDFSTVSTIRTLKLQSPIVSNACLSMVDRLGENR